VKQLILVLLTALGAHASISPILTNVVSSDFGVSGTGGYESDIFVHFGLDQYDAADVGLPNLQQEIYFRYSYIFVTVSPTAVEDFSQVVIGLPDNCAIDSECVFGFEENGSAFNTGAIGLHTLKDASSVYGIKLDGVSPTGGLLAISFFSNRIPGGDKGVYVRGVEDFFSTDPGIAIAPDLHILPQAEPPEQTPEPVTTALIGSGLATGILLRMRRSN